jgi:hypothetical protein
MTPVALTQNTAGRLKRLLGDQDGGEGGPAAGVGGQGSALVRCTSITAAGGSGVAAQCYPGVIVDPASDLTTQGELGNVWLTPLGDSAAVQAPTLNRLYAVQVAGYLDIGGDVRPRVFTVADSFSGIHVYQSSPTTIAHNTSTNLTFDSVRYNVGNYTNNASGTGSIRVNEAGYYLIGAQWWCHLTAAGGRWVKIGSSLYTEYIAGQGNTDGGTGLLETQLNASIVWKAAANESFNVAVFQNSGVAMTPSSGRVAEFWINKLG